MSQASRSVPHSTHGFSGMSTPQITLQMGWQRSLKTAYILDNDLVFMRGSVRGRLDLQGLTLRFGLPCCCVGRHSVLKRSDGKNWTGRDGDQTDSIAIAVEEEYSGTKKCEGF